MQPSMLMVQPSLTSFTFEGPPQPVLLDVASMRQDPRHVFSAHPSCSYSSCVFTSSCCYSLLSCISSATLSLTEMIRVVTVRSLAAMAGRKMPADIEDLLHMIKHICAQKRNGEAYAPVSLLFPLPPVSPPAPPSPCTRKCWPLCSPSCSSSSCAIFLLLPCSLMTRQVCGYRHRLQHDKEKVMSNLKGYCIARESSSQSIGLSKEKSQMHSQ